MKQILLGVLVLFSTLVSASQVENLAKEQLQERVHVINTLQNAILMKDSKVADVDALFANFTDDFEYVHEVYGGTYSRQHLYDNYVKFLHAGNYKRTTPRYKIMTMLAGHNAVAVERQQMLDGKLESHLSVFEFKGRKISKIIEYWQ
ncbi:hypothetical protein [Pseudoalteromonas sp. T1lg23B]|uniref:hypothetical protein n=1 Tax=Pseudoalteromonas sp. T1lg23B TaxID=2077097 RepID=UPI000CF71E85|nr:hypothetical protein [Pseudoalteromonas sp. T1lg23B]